MLPSLIKALKYGKYGGIIDILQLNTSNKPNFRSPKE
jgi:hypothetical protein